VIAAAVLAAGLGISSARSSTSYRTISDSISGTTDLNHRTVVTCATSRGAARASPTRWQATGPRSSLY
jgi:hypothetical protein